MKYYKSETCNDLKDFLDKIKDHINNGWVFRGLRKDSWGLQHRFERACNRFNVPRKDRQRVEYNMIREFKRRLHQYTANIPATDATDEWLALMQHYGAPTRFLDFTYSPYVAAYFAFEHAQANSNIAIWAINDDWFAKQWQDIPEIIKRKYYYYRKLREKHREYFRHIFMKEKGPQKLLLSVNPFRLNERLAYQRGVFLCPGDISVSLEENLTVYGDETRLSEHIIQYTLETGQQNENTIQALDYLDTMNINRITLFPGLDGFAQSFEPRTNSLFLRQYSR